jgi:hypothetical protein
VQVALGSFVGFGVFVGGTGVAVGCTIQSHLPFSLVGLNGLQYKFSQHSFSEAFTLHSAFSPLHDFAIASKLKLSSHQRKRVNNIPKIKYIIKLFFNLITSNQKPISLTL